MKMFPGWLIVAATILVIFSPMLPAPVLMALAGLGLVGAFIALRWRRGRP